MDTQQAYNSWSGTYDTNVNKTRDLEATAARLTLHHFSCKKIIEIGCGTGKNTVWLKGKCAELVAVDFSAEMLAVAKTKAESEQIHFIEADITHEWAFGTAGLVTCSLVLEHIPNLAFIFEQAALALEKGGHFYLCELHPFKQLQGSRAKFEKNGSLHQLEYFIHHISDYFEAAKIAGFQCFSLKEWFDDNDRQQCPRLVSFLFKKM